MRTPERQRAWREKIGLMSIIVASMAGVGFLTFGFNQTVCGTPPNRYLAGTIDKASVIINGHDYDFSHFRHPAVSGVFTGKENPLYEGGWGAAGMDLSFMFQYNRGSCRNIITAASGSAITQQNGLLDWMFPCNIYNQWGTSTVNLTGYDNSTDCHIKTGTQAQVQKYRPSGQVYYSWENVTDDNRNLVVYESCVVYFVVCRLLTWC
jgi:chitin synthase